MRCPHCNFDNLPGVEHCISCGTRMRSVQCPRCDAVNPVNSSSCLFCGFELQGGRTSGGNAEVLESRPPARMASRDGDPSPVAAVVLESRPPARTASRDGDPSPVALVGFGAITALAAAAYPWYSFGGDQAQATTLSELFELGWRGFPGIPLALIVTAAIASTTAMLVPGLASIRAPTVVVSGLVTLVSASWLSEGIARFQSGSVDSTLPITGAMLQTIGAIVLIATGFWLGRTQATKNASPEGGSATLSTTDDAHRRA